ncbi:bifunctional adenosylcobinamide kinase/adenosylcobinamide-phosphate guanylyltransferase [Nocardioides sp. zg-536]|uniref:Adenosylcobinamide kinase n=1 Tax=Nocardioides faecalis TaxID=2803858 RepID=A0A938Y4C2_9ACTN|nr:bifunctional adenosylcobinamide kinase/adenosylcobinamide-phosphate guanylyltransferase [Nocardioides faecalis]MBM9461656.1 bifunctional adenosylcobinamide kinase/adenosylcobinamide-phosphate guanylyltransferase [Nocardioides faecalis]QVI59925.1 bifunctional adenosylcobinamide kinase/adenosylcobinamide-phosphate guanylyltransferase [Nocardioides faecalis]
MSSSHAAPSVLVTGGVRSGKSRHAEALLVAAEEDSPHGLPVTYVAAGPSYDDADWAARIATHRARRPAGWRTAETRDVAGVLAGSPGPVLVDCLGTWLTGLIDAAELWEAPVGEIETHVLGHVDALVTALRERPAEAGQVVLVTNEVGLGVVPEHRSARVFRDLLGTINQRVGAVCDEVHLVVAGRVLRL